MSYRYLGNKARIAEWICEIVMTYLNAGDTIADPMCGTASMSRAFAERGLRVIASDQLLFPTLHAKARLLDKRHFNFEPVCTSYQEAISKLNLIEPTKGFIWREYSGEGNPRNGVKPRMYFTGENASKIDAIRKKILDWSELGLPIQSIHLLLHDLILASNKVANIAGTYGYYRSKWDKNSLMPISLQMTNLSESRNQHVVHHGTLEEIVPTLDINACYLDPPYTKRQYAGNYHILETIAQQDEPEPAGQGGLRDWTAESSEFCYKRKAKNAFEKSISLMKCPLVFVSYSEDAQVSANDMHIMLSTFGTVTKFEKPLNRYRSNNRGMSGNVSEHLYVLEKSI